MRIPKTMKAAVLHGIGEVRIERRPVPKPKRGEALIRVRAVGVCGSEIHYYSKGRIGAAVVDKPMVLGHEFSGEVAAIGPSTSLGAVSLSNRRAVKGLKIGQRVAVEPGAPCWECEPCRQGNYHLCPQMIFCGKPPHDGAYQEYVAWPARLCFPMPRNVSFADAAMIEPAAVGFQAVKVAPVHLADTVLVIGCAAIGLVTIQAALLSGAARVIATDVLDYRLKVAKQIGADVTLNPRRFDVAQKVLELTNGRGVDVAYEAVGRAETFQQAVNASRPAGRVGLIGIPGEDLVPLNFHHARHRETQIQMVRRYVHLYPRVLDMLARRRLDLRYLVTHRFGLDRVEEAFKLVQEARDGVIKALITL